MRSMRLGLLVVGLGLLATGCPNPNLYGTPRTIPGGKLAGFAALEGVGYSVRTKAIIAPNAFWNPSRNYSGFFPQAPTLGFRVGIVDRVDVGARLTGFTTPGADLKLNFLKTDAFDMAADAGIEYAPAIATRVHLPLLAGINFSRQISLVLLPGVMYAKSNADDLLSSSSTFRTITGAGGWYWRFGLGVAFRTAKNNIAFQPEVTVVKAFKQEKDPLFESVMLYNLGFGFVFGSLPDYGPPEEPATPPTPAPVVAGPSLPPPGHPPDSGAPPPSMAPSAAPTPAPTPAPDAAPAAPAGH